MGDVDLNSDRSVFLEVERPSKLLGSEFLFSQSVQFGGL